MAFHDRMREMVIRRLGTGRGGVGVALTLQKHVPGEYDPSIGDYTSPSTTEYPGTGVRVNYSDRAYVNTGIIYGDFQIYVSPILSDYSGDMPTPAVNDTFVFNGQVASVISVSPFNDNQNNCGWKVQVRYV